MSFANYFSGNQKITQLNTTFVIARVTKVIYGPLLANGSPDPDYNDPTDIGKIRYIVSNSSQASTSSDQGNAFAKPAWPSIKHIPLENEYVYIIPGPGLELNEKAGAQDFYYLPPFGLWGASNHNAFPALSEYAAYKNIEQTNQEQKKQGLSDRQGDKSIEYPLGNAFVEKTNIKTLRPFVGDVTLEGRWGNSIRFGSSLKSNVNENNWATSNNDGDPIVIIRNGQGVQVSTEGWIPTVEDINIDKSSIYLTSGQRVIMDDINNNFTLNSFDTQVEGTITQVKNLTQIPNVNDSLSPNFVDTQINKHDPNTV